MHLRRRRSRRLGAGGHLYPPHPQPRRGGPRDGVELRRHLRVPGRLLARWGRSRVRRERPPSCAAGRARWRNGGPARIGRDAARRRSARSPRPEAATSLKQRLPQDLVTDAYQSVRCCTAARRTGATSCAVLPVLWPIKPAGRSFVGGAPRPRRGSSHPSARRTRLQDRPARCPSRSTLETRSARAARRRSPMPDRLVGAWPGATGFPVAAYVPLGLAGPQRRSRSDAEAADWPDLKDGMPAGSPASEDPRPCRPSRPTVVEPDDPRVPETGAAPGASRPERCRRGRAAPGAKPLPAIVADAPIARHAGELVAAARPSPERAARASQPRRPAALPPEPPSGPSRKLRRASLGAQAERRRSRGRGVQAGLRLRRPRAVEAGVFGRKVPCRSRPPAARSESVEPRRRRALDAVCGGPSGLERARSALALAGSCPFGFRAALCWPPGRPPDPCARRPARLKGLDLDLRRAVAGEGLARSARRRCRGSRTWSRGRRCGSRRCPSWSTWPRRQISGSSQRRVGVVAAADVEPEPDRRSVAAAARGRRPARRVARRSRSLARRRRLGPRPVVEQLLRRRQARAVEADQGGGDVLGRAAGEQRRGRAPGPPRPAPRSGAGPRAGAPGRLARISSAVGGPRPFGARCLAEASSCSARRRRV